MFWIIRIPLLPDDVLHDGLGDKTGFAGAFSRLLARAGRLGLRHGCVWLWQLKAVAFEPNNAPLLVIPERV